MNPLIDQFLNTLSSHNTKISYQTDITQFFDFCAQNLDLKIDNSLYFDPNMFNEKVFLVWRHSLKDLKQKTIHRKIASLSSFFSYLYKKKLVPKNPLNLIKRPVQKPINKAAVLNEKEINHLIDTVFKTLNLFSNDKTSKQYNTWFVRYTMIYVLFTVGLRVSELCNLQKCDLELTNDGFYKLHLTIKGNQEHAPIINPKTALVLQEFFNRDDFKNYSRFQVLHMLRVCVKEAGLDKKITPHSLRATLATLLNNRNVPLKDIAHVLGHKKLETTVKYTRTDEKNLRDNALILDQLSDPH